MEQENIFLRSDAIQNLLNREMSFFLRYSLGILFFAGLLVLSLCWFIKYPDSIQGKIVLTTDVTPKAVVTKTGGKVAKLYVNSGQTVAQGAMLAQIESLADYGEVMRLKKELQKLDVQLSQQHFDRLKTSSFEKFMQLGEIQGSFEAFHKALYELDFLLSDRFYSGRQAIIASKLKAIEQLNENLALQQQTYEQDYRIAEENYALSEKLLEQKAISQSELKTAESALLAKKLTLQQLKSSIISNRNTQNDLKDQLIQLQQGIELQKSAFLQAYKNLAARVREWENQFIVTAPISGTVSLPKILNENQNVALGGELCYIVPGHSSVIGETVVSQYNFGKVKVGQEVVVKFDVFPFEEFGSVRGQVLSISEVPVQDNYIVRIKFPHGLTTTYHKKLSYRNGMTGRAEIITAEHRLLEKLLFKARGIADL